MKETNVRNLLALIGLLVVGGAVLGWYMGWYTLSFNKSDDGTLQIKTDVDTKKVTDDTSNAFKNIATVVNNQAEKGADGKTPNTTPGTTPGPVNPSQGSAINPLAPTTPQSPTQPTREPIRLFPPR